MSRRPGPGPGAYMLPTTVGYDHHDATKKRNPAYSLGKRTGGYSEPPGPTPYNIEGLTQYGKAYSPAYSMGGRHDLPSKNVTPGPGTYAPENCPRMKEPRPPAYSIKGRGLGRKDEGIPGPDHYYPGTHGPGVPSFSIAGRLDASVENKSPGPATYAPTELNLYKNKQAQVSIAGRNYPPGDKTKKPGPNSYHPMYVEGKNQPNFSFGVRHAEDALPYVLEEDNF